MGAAHYLKLLDKDRHLIEGESEGYDFEDCIDITGWNWDVTDESAKKAAAPKDLAGKGTTGPAKASAGGGEVGVVPSLFTFNKAVDASTTRLMTEMFCGNVLQEATFTLLEEKIGDDGERSDVFRLNVVLEDVRVASYGLSVRASEHRVDMEETWGLDYTTIRFDFASARGMTAMFKRPPGSEKGAAAKSEVNTVDLQRTVAEHKKALADLQQATAVAAAAAKGKRGG